ncbi:hypothetical protein BCON_0575g00030 [Botryotinia convoluta]|uniref:Uncharacterized protein n=1 Tax=Botryotinia convoluta TaxID=54673 RepID=A0A4Z1H7W3_9HELO|nr:hypothetical protein BCON_0575g00030 [Botryotinia convoluta]
MPTSYKIAKPDKLPEKDEEINFEHRRLRKLDEIVRELIRKESSERTRIINDLKERVIPKMTRDIQAARVEISEKEERQKVVESDKMSLLNQHPPGSKEYNDAKLLHNTACCILYSYQRKLPEKIREYEAYVESCTRVLNSYPQYHYDEEMDHHLIHTSHYDED